MDTSELDISLDKLLFLRQNEIPEDSISNLISGATYYQQMGGVHTNSYWQSQKFDNRDEFFVVLSAYFSLFGLIHKLPNNNEWRLKFDVAYGFQIKSTAQSALAINNLTQNFCYADSFVICRTMISRLNLLLICALNPNLFDDWLKNQKDERFLDGKIRLELINNGVFTVPHLYELSSEIIHSQFIGLSDIGYMEQGLFTELKPINNQVYVMAKFIIAMSYQAMLSMALQDYEGKPIPNNLKSHEILFDWLQENYLLGNRIDHIFTFMAEDRHWAKVGKNQYSVGGAFNLSELRIQIEKFHRKGQKKRLSKKYDT